MASEMKRAKLENATDCGEDRLGSGEAKSPATSVEIDGLASSAEVCSTATSSAAVGVSANSMSVDGGMDVQAEKLREDLFKKPASALAKRLDILYRTRGLADCTFILGEDKVKIVAHRIFLAIASEVFYAMLFGAMAMMGDISIPDLTAYGFNGMIKYVYTDEINFDSLQHAFEVLMVARKYVMPHLEKKCFKYMVLRITATDCLEYLERARFLDYKELEEHCLQVLKMETTKVLEHPSFLEVQVSTLETIVQQDVLEIESEFDIFEKVENWMRAENKRSGETLKEVAKRCGEVIKHIRFLVMPITEFALGPQKSEILSDDEKLAVYRWSSTLDKRYLPSSLSHISKSRCDASRYNRTLKFRIDISFLCQMAEGEPIKSQAFIVDCITWRIMANKDKNNITFYIHADKETEMTIEAKMRLIYEKENDSVCPKNTEKMTTYSDWENLEEDTEDNRMLTYPRLINPFKYKDENYNRVHVQVNIESICEDDEIDVPGDQTV